jgi:hypothetical protein
MRFLFSRITKAQVFTPCLIGLIAISAWAVNYRGGRAASLPAGSQSGVAKSDKKLVVETFTLRPDGFDPEKITRAKGAFFIFIENRSGLDDLTFQFDRTVGNKQKELETGARRNHWKGVVDLTPGTYTLTEARHPEFKLTLTIMP